MASILSRPQCVNDMHDEMALVRMAVYPTLQWRNNELDGVSKSRRIDCLLNRLFRRRSRKTSMLPLWGEFTGGHLMTLSWVNLYIDTSVMKAARQRSSMRLDYRNTRLEVLTRSWQMTKHWISIHCKLLSILKHCKRFYANVVSCIYLSIYLSCLYATILKHLTNIPLLPHICVSESDQHWFR